MKHPPRMPPAIDLCENLHSSMEMRKSGPAQLAILDSTAERLGRPMGDA